VDHDHRQLFSCQSPHHLTFNPASGFQHDQRGLVFTQPLDQGPDSNFIVRMPLPATQWAYVNIESCFGYIDTNKNGNNFQNSILLFFRSLHYSSTLQIMRALITQATVRALGRRDGTTLARLRPLMTKARSIYPVPFGNHYVYTYSST